MLLDLYCAGGGAAMGYHRAGFDVVGVDCMPRPHYPFDFVEDDALAYLHKYGGRYDAIHASPPCQRFSQMRFCRPGKVTHPDLLTPTLRSLAGFRVPWIVENVPQSPIGPYAVELCGLMFGLKVFRHRLFACSHALLVPPHPSHKGKLIGENGFVCVAGHGGQGTGFNSTHNRRKVPKDHRTVGSWRSAMGIDWLPRDMLAQAIPPAYTEYLGRQLINVITRGSHQ